MKKIIAAIALLGLSAGSFAQNVNKRIKEADVLRIIKTLSADDMEGRGTFTPGIEKAARFIEGEYKKIGLKPMAGDSGYRQNFTMIKTAPVKEEVSINGVSISRDNIAAVGGESFTWSPAADAEVVKETPDKDLS